MKSMLAFIMGWSLAFCAETSNPIVGAVAGLGALAAFIAWSGMALHSAEGE